MDAEEFKELTHGLSCSQIGELAGVSDCTVRRWLAESAPIPYAVQQLFRLLAHGVAGKDWEGWRFGRDGLLYHPYWRRGFTGHDLAAVWIEIQQVKALQREVRRLEEEKNRLADELHLVEMRCDFYRLQVRLEARMGMALVRIAG